MDTKDRLEWIKTAAYFQILQKWRFEPTGSPWVHGEVGQALKERFVQLRAETPHDTQIMASKRIGW